MLNNCFTFLVCLCLLDFFDLDLYSWILEYFVYFCTFISKGASVYWIETKINMHFTLSLNNCFKAGIKMLKNFQQ